MGTPIANLPVMDSTEDDVDNLLSQMDNRPADTPTQQEQSPPPQPSPRPAMEHYNDVPRIKRHKKTSLSDRILRESKVPMIVALLFFLLNISTVNTQLTMRFNRLVNNETGDLNYFGVAVKAIVMGILYYVVKMFV